MGLPSQFHYGPPDIDLNLNGPPVQPGNFALQCMIHMWPKEMKRLFENICIKKILFDKFKIIRSRLIILKSIL